MTAARCLWLTKGLGRGGVERLLVDMLPLVDADAFEVDVAYVLPWKDNHHRAFEDLGAEVHCLGARGASYPRWVGGLRRLIAGGRYDLIHSHSPVPGSMARLATWGRNRPVLIHTEHNVWDRYRLPTRWLNSLTYHRNSSVIAVSDTVARSIRPVWSRRAPEVHTVHHGTVLSSVRHLTPEQRVDGRRALGLPAGDFIIGTVANFTPKKDHHNLLRALAGSGPIAKAHLVLIGLGPLEDELRQLAGELSIVDRVTFLGSRDDVFELLPLFDAFCLSSRFEGFPISLVEAMATGLACVATTVGGIPEILDDDRNGLLVPPGDPLALRAALERLATDEPLVERLGARAETDSQRLDLRHAVDRLQQLYREAIGDTEP
jgi:glycosyltransferase involved in cell wall biosynthesis